MSTIYTGVPASHLSPGIYVNVDLGRGEPSAAGIAKRVLLVGNKLDTNTTDGTFTEAELVKLFEPSKESDDGTYAWDTHFPSAHAVSEGMFCRISDLRDAAQKFGYGSELYLMANAAFSADRNVNLWGFVNPEASGSRSVAQVTLGVADDGSPVSQKGFLTVSLLGQTMLVPVAEKHDATEVASSFQSMFDARFKTMPFYCVVDPGGTATSASVSINAKHTNKLWNDVAISVDAGDTNVNIIADSATAGSSVVHDLDTAQNTAFHINSNLWAERFHYIVSPATDGKNAKALKTYLAAQADPVNGIRQQGLFGSTADLDDTLVTLTQCSEPRVQCVWAVNNLYFPAQLAAGAAAVRAKWEGSDPAVNLCRKPVMGVPNMDDVDLPTVIEKNTAIGSGITPLVPYQGTMVILRSVTTAAANELTPVLDTGKVTVSDHVADDIQLKMTARYKGFKLSPDTSLPLPSRVTTPSRIRGAIIEWLRQMEALGIITRVGELSEKVLVELDENVAGRVNFEIPEDVVDIFAVGAGNIIQMG